MLASFALPPCQFVSVTAPTELAGLARGRQLPGSHSRLLNLKWRACLPAVQLDAAEFLRTNWGQTPMLLRDLVPGFHSPITPDELAGLACMHEVESRIVSGTGPSPSIPKPHYALRVGPFDEELFQNELPDHEPWTLLVHEVNRWNPLVANLLDKFTFIPNWRVDDVMVSYATRGGGVGPHVDNYDVFLLQGAGARRWRFGFTPIPPDEESLIPDLDVSILEGGFEADDDIVLYPGDCLYIPSRYPHWGESLDNDCMTYSIGFRAPTVADLAVGWTETLTEEANLQNVYLTDAKSDLHENMHSPGKITDAVVKAAYDAVLRTLKDSPSSRARFDAWFCEQVSSPKRFRAASSHDESPGIAQADARAIVDNLLGPIMDEHLEVRQKEGSVFVYRELTSDYAKLYVDGEAILQRCSKKLADLVCGRRARSSIEYATQFQSCEDEELRSHLQTLFANDLLYISVEEEDIDDLEGALDEEEDDIDD